MKRTIATLLAIALMATLFTVGLAEEQQSWIELFNEIWDVTMPTAFTFDETPAEGTILSGGLEESLALTVTELEDGKVEILVEILSASEPTVDAAGQTAPLLDAEKTAAFMALIAAIRAQVPDWKDSNEIMDRVSEAISTKIFPDEGHVGYESNHDGEEVTVKLEDEVLFTTFVDATEEIAWYKLTV